MALEMQDLMALKSMGGKDGMSPYEQVKLDYMSSKRPSNVAVTGIVFGGAALVGVAASMILGGMYSNAKAGQAKEAANGAKELAATQYQAALQLMAQQNQSTQATLDRMITALNRETDARTAGDTNISQTITDTISGQQSGSQTATLSQTTAVDNTMQQIMTQTLSDAITGKSSLNPQPVMIFSAPQPCNCPGCGCNG